MLTTEQEIAIAHYGTGDDQALEAYAGAGKTFILTKMAANDMESKIGFLSFNKSIATDAAKKFPGNTECRTAHSHAYRAVVARDQAKQERLNRKVYAKQHAQILGIHSSLEFGDDLVLSPYNLAVLVGKGVTNFCYSAEAEIDWMHVPYVPGADMTELRAFLLPYMRKLWADKMSPNGKCGYTHDDYFKEWSLSGPRLPFDVVMIDEAQDSNPALFVVVEGQRQAQKVIVGDPNQQIYAWRGAVDAISTFNAKNRDYLTKSFRFGEAVAVEANKWLTLLGHQDRPLVGFEEIDSVVVEHLADPDAILCRTNATAISEAMQAHTADRSYAIVGGTDEIKKFAESAQALMNGSQFGVKHPDLIAFKNWGAVREFVEEEGSDLKVLVKLIDDYGPDTIIKVANEAVPEQRADVTISTAHKAKGREWDKVKIANDFTEPVNEDGSDGELSRGEMMLAYVAVTRAQKQLDNSGLAWVDRWVDKFRAAQKDTDNTDEKENDDG